LDATIQWQVLNLLKRLQKEMGLSYLFITHNIGVVAYFADYVGVMYRGKLVEQGTTERVLFSPQHEYTKSLLASVPKIQSNEMTEECL